MIGMTLDQIYTQDQVERSRKGLEKIIKEGAHKPVITSMKKRDGAELRVEAISSALNSPNGRFIATVTMSRPLASDNMLRALNLAEMGKVEPFD